MTDWKTIRLKFVAPSTREILSTRPDGMRYLGLENIESRTGRLLLDIEQEQVDSSVVCFDQSSVLFGKLRPYLAKVAIPDFRGVATTEIMVFKPTELIERRFLYYLLLSDSFIKQVSAMTDGAKMPRVDPKDILNLSFAIPPLATQLRITAYLDEQTAKIDKLTTSRLPSNNEKFTGLLERKIELLQEYRAALIDECVTGEREGIANGLENG